VIADGHQISQFLDNVDKSPPAILFSVAIWERIASKSNHGDMNKM
jgi:hypothetical protein